MTFVTTHDYDYIFDQERKRNEKTPPHREGNVNLSFFGRSFFSHFAHQSLCFIFPNSKVFFLYCNNENILFTF